MVGCRCEGEHGLETLEMLVNDENDQDQVALPVLGTTKRDCCHIIVGSFGVMGPSFWEREVSSTSAGL
jgi:hypothetical protein